LGKGGVLFVVWVLIYYGLVVCVLGWVDLRLAHFLCCQKATFNVVESDVYYDIALVGLESKFQKKKGTIA